MAPHDRSPRPLCSIAVGARGAGSGVYLELKCCSVTSFIDRLGKQDNLLHVRAGVYIFYLGISKTEAREEMITKRSKVVVRLKAHRHVGERFLPLTSWSWSTSRSSAS